MSKLTMMRGLPASGKSTHVKEIVEQGGWIRVNRDLLREMMHFGKWSGENEGKVIEAEKVLARHFLGSGVGVIVDDTNMSQKHKDMWRNLCVELDAEMTTLEKGTPVKECLDREEKRDKVGKHVIMGMALQFEKLEKPDKPFVLCDIDGTIADCEHRRIFVKDEVKNWKGFFGAMAIDLPIKTTLDLLEEYKKKGHQIILLTARPEDYRKVTEDWLEKFTNINPLTVIMRRKNDTRPETVVKQEMFETYFKDKYEIETMIDDRPSTIQMWKENNVPVIDVGKGEDF